MLQHMFNAPTVMHVFNLVEAGNFNLLKVITLEQVCAKKHWVKNAIACQKELADRYDDITQFIVYQYSTDSWGEIDELESEKIRSEISIGKL